jgi:protein-S-isoprenylcysteine O-methyltransferase Ste14
MRRLLPPVLVGVLLMPLFALRRVQPLMDPVPDWLIIAGPLLALLALVGLAVARRQFARADAEIMTFNQPRNLVTAGLFAHSRNPMYLSMLLLLAGGALLTGHWIALLAPAIFFIAANWWYIPFEERAAATTFGEPYLLYAARVRRWI